MSPPSVPLTVGLASFLKSLKQDPIGKSVYLLASLVQRQQITGSKACAIATTQLLLRVIADFKEKDIWLLVERIREVGRTLIDSQPQAFVIGNIVRRALSLVREIAEDRHHASRGNVDSTSLPSCDLHIQNAPTVATSLFELFSRPESPSPAPTPPSMTPAHSGSMQSAFSNLQIRDSKSNSSNQEPKSAKDDFKADVLEGIREILDEIEQVDDQIAAFSPDHIHSNETILVHSASMTVHKFLLTAAKKRKFTVIHVESYPNEHEQTRSMMLYGKSQQGGAEEAVGARFKPLTSAGITVISVPDSAVFAIMSRVNKVILDPHAVLANGGLVASAGAHAIALAAQLHKTPVVVLSGVFKLSPIHPFMTDRLVAHGDPDNVQRMSGVKTDNPSSVCNVLTDFVTPDLVDLYITNLGGHAPSYLYRIVADHYHHADLNL